MIVQAAIRRAEAHGLEKLSARKLAQDLGCEAMSLYHHIGSMDRLHDAMVDELLASIPTASTGGAVDAMLAEARAYLTLATTYPRSFRLIAARRWKGDRATEVAARAIGRFTDLGFDSTDALTRARVLGAYLNGAGLALAAWATDPQQSAAGDARRVADDLNLGLAMLVGTLSVPAMTR